MLTPEQKEFRKNGVGASDSPIIMGFSSYKTPYVLYLEKCGLISCEQEETELQYWGNKLEPLIINEFEKRNNIEVLSNLETVIHPNKSYFLANLDGFIPAWNAVLEVKTSNSFMRHEWGEDGSDIIPMQYLIQIAHQCVVKDAEKGYLAVLIGGNEYREYEYKRDPELETLIIEAVDEFWLNRVLPRIEPDSISIEDSRLKYKQSLINSSKPTTPQTISILNSLHKTKETKKTLEKQEEHFKMQIMEYMKEAECLLDESGKPVVTLKPNAKGNRVFLLK